MEIGSLPYIDIQHDALSVFDDVDQGVVCSEDIWISGYRNGSTSVHGKAKVRQSEGPGGIIDLIPRDGITIQRDSHSKTNFVVSVPALGMADIPIKFPRQVIHPPYKKRPLSAPLQINAMAHSPVRSQLVVGGPDGFCVVLDAGPEGLGGAVGGRGVVELKGHVGDVLDVKWFPSGEVVLTASSDLSIRIFGAQDGINPRILKGHTRAITCLHILGVGRQVLSGSKDGTVRLWDVSLGKEIGKWEMEGRKAVEGFVVLEDEGLGLEDGEIGVIVALRDGLEVWVAKDGAGRRVKKVETGAEGALISLGYSQELGVLVTGHANGVIAIHRISTFSASTETSIGPTLIRRNESPIYSLVFAGEDLLVGTAAGLPCRLGISEAGDNWRIWTKVEYAGWEAVGVECWAVGKDGVWCGGGEGGLRRY